MLKAPCHTAHLAYPLFGALMPSMSASPQVSYSNATASPAAVRTSTSAPAQIWIAAGRKNHVSARQEEVRLQRCSMRCGPTADTQDQDCTAYTACNQSARFHVQDMEQKRAV